MALDLYQDQINDNLAKLTPTQDVEPGVFANFFSGAGRATMRGFAETARAASMALAPAAIAEDAYYGTSVAKERFFKWHDEVFGRAVDYWTPKPNEVGVAGEVAGKLISMIPQVIASPALTVASQQLTTAEDLVRKHTDVSAAQANVVGAIQGAGLGLGIWMPILGQNLVQRVLIGGAGFNVAQGVGTRAASGMVLADSKAAKEFDAFDGKALTLDVLLGLAFGGIAHFVPSQRAQGAEAWGRINAWAKGLKPSEIDALLVLREAQHINEDSLPGKPATPEAVSIHVDKVRAAIDQLASDRQLDVAHIDVPRESYQGFELPAPTEGNVRVYRGETAARAELPDWIREDLKASGALDAQGRWWTTDPEIAKWYVDDAGESGIMLYQDVPAAVVEQSRVSGLPDAIKRFSADPANELFLPKEYVGRGSTLFEVDPAKVKAAEQQFANLQEAAVRVRREEGLPRVEEQRTIPPRDITPLEPVAQARAVGQHIERKLIETGMQRDEALANAAIWEAFAKSAYERYGIPPAELLTKYGVDVRRMDNADKLLGALEQRYSQIDTPAFKNWFGNSKVVDAEGKPLVVYHGTGEDFNIFDWDAPVVNQSNSHPSTYGPYFTTVKGEADRIARSGMLGNFKNETPITMEVFLSIKKPYDVGGDPSIVLNRFGSHAEAKEWMQSQGYDGLYIHWRSGKAWYVPFERTQIKSAIGNRGTFDPNNPNILFQEQPFYSQLTRGIESLKTTTAPAKGWKDTLKGLVSKGAVKQAEIEATGLNEWLDLQQGRVTKQQVQDYLAQNGVKVEEMTLGGQPVNRQSLADRYSRRTDEELRQELESRTNEIGSTPAGMSRQQIIDRIVDTDMSYYESNVSDFAGGTKFSQYQLPGGENYRELLLTLPTTDKFDPSKVDFTRKRISTTQGTVTVKYDGREIGTFDDSGDIANNYRRPEAEIREMARRLWEKGAPNSGIKPISGGFRSSHFDQPNILAHIRFNERTDADGKKVLFIEEIQSDWAQKGKKSGFRDDGPKVEPNTGQFADSRPWRVGDTLYASRANAEDAAKKWFQDGVPGAPFVRKTEAWVGLSMKRMIRYAAENGFDRVAWTTGEQQAARYDLSKQVSLVQWHPQTKRMIVTDTRGNTVIDKAVDQNQLADYIGKEPAEKLVNSEAKEADGTQFIEGENLKIGGEGMKAFYDKIVPNVANDVLKKMGGGRVGEVGINSESMYERGFPSMRAAEQWGEANLGDHDFSIRGLSESEGTFAVFDEFDKKLIKGDTTIQQPGFDITPALREKVMAGVPLFQAGARGSATSFGQTGQSLIHLFENADKTTFMHESAHVFLEMQKDLVMREGAPMAALQDWATLSKWLKMEGGPISRESHEKFARGWEKFLAEGVAPNDGLKRVFKQLRDWFIDVYKSLMGTDVELNNQIRGVMARMLDSQAKDPINKGGLEDPRLTDPEYRSALDMMARESGWAEEGGRMIRDPQTGEVVSRTKWIAHSEWYQRLQQDEKARLPGGRRGVEEAVRKAVMGEIMSAQEKRAVTWMLDEHKLLLDHWNKSGANAHPDGDPFEIANAQHADGIEPTRENTLNMALIDRALQVDREAYEAIPTNLDDAAYMARVKEIVDAHKPAAQKTDQGGEEATAKTEHVGPQPQPVGAGSPPPPGGAGEAAGGAAAPNMAAREARTIAAENPDMKVRVGTESDGTPVYKSLNDMLDDAELDAKIAMEDMNLITVAAECLMGVA